MTPIVLILASGLFLLLAGRGLRRQSKIAAVVCIKTPGQETHGSNRPGSHHERHV